MRSKFTLDKMTTPVIYSLDSSPPCRTVLMIAGLLGLELEVRRIDLLKSEELKEDLLKINPQLTVPLLIDDGFILVDSHVISTYFVNKYGKDDSLYPKDIQKRALVHQYCYFDVGYLFKNFRLAIVPLLTGEAHSFSESHIQLVRSGYEMLNRYLEGKEWLVGNSYTVADISCCTTVHASTAIVGVDDYPNVNAWLHRCKTKIPGFENMNHNGKKELYDVIHRLLH